MGAAPLARTLFDACRRWPDRVAISHRGTSLTYQELGDRVQALAGAYRRLGIRPGDRVLCGLLDCPEHVMAVAAAWACRAIHVGVDNDLTGTELSALVERTDATAVLAHPRADRPDALEPLQALRRDHPRTMRIVHEARAEAGDLLMADLLEEPTPGGTADLPYGDDEAALMFLTSGTTGRPKGVLETLPACWAKMQFFANAFSPGIDDVHLVYLPMTHVFGLRLALMALLSGGRLVLLDRFSARVALQLVTTEQVTVLPAMPVHLNLLLAAVEPGDHRVDSLRWVISAAAGLPRPLAERVFEQLGVEVLFVFGCSEGFTTLTTDRGEILAGSVGRTVFRGPPGTPPTGRVAIMRPGERAPLPAGEVGEIVFAAAVPVRYWRDPDVATDGWYRTGDLGCIDHDGRLYVLGRLNDLVNRGGLKVSPTEVETVLVRHPAVADGAVLATPDPVLGEATCACVVPAGEETPSLGALRDFLGQTLARHKLPDELCLLDRIPRSPIGKVERSTLRELVVGADAPRERLRPRVRT